MPDPKTPDELADALVKRIMATTGDDYTRSLRKLARDAAALGAVKALEDAATDVDDDRGVYAALEGPIVNNQMGATDAAQDVFVKWLRSRAARVQQ